MYLDVELQSRDYKNVTAPFSVVCSWSKCQLVIKQGAPAHKYDGATYTHAQCPSLPLKRYATHKYTDSGLTFN